jgi:hypothetical protein
MPHFPTVILSYSIFFSSNLKIGSITTLHIHKRDAKQALMSHSATPMTDDLHHPGPLAAPARYLKQSLNKPLWKSHCDEVQIYLKMYYSTKLTTR